MSGLKILAECILVPHTISVNGSLVFDRQGGDAESFFREAYHQLGIEYPKFHKMDSLSKLAFLGTEYLLKSFPLQVEDDELAMVFHCGSSSAESDSHHQALIQSKSKVSPAIFVYTLPNILMGEIAIRNKWYGENLLILAKDFDFDAWKRDVVTLFDTKKATFGLGGWVEFFQGNYELRLYLAGV